MYEGHHVEETLTFGEFLELCSSAISMLLPDVHVLSLGAKLACRRERAFVVFEQRSSFGASVTFVHGDSTIEAVTPIRWDALQECIADLVGFFTGAPMTSLTMCVRDEAQLAAVMDRDAALTPVTHCSCLHAVNAHHAGGCQAQYRDDYGGFTRCPCNRGPQRVAERSDAMKHPRVLAAAVRRRASRRRSRFLSVSPPART